MAGLKTGVLLAAKVIASPVAGFLPVESNYTERIVELFLHNPAVPTIPTLPVGSFYLNWTTTVLLFTCSVYCMDRHITVTAFSLSQNGLELPTETRIPLTDQHIEHR